MRISKEIQKEYGAKGLNAFLTSHQVSIDAEGKNVHLSYESLYKRTRALLLDQRVDALVMVVQNDEFLHTGLPLMYIDSVHTVSENVYMQKDPHTLIPDEALRRLKILIEG